MVERTHTGSDHADAASAGFWPHVVDTARTVGSRIAEFFAPPAAAAAMADSYEVSVELPGVAAQDVTVEVHGNTLTLKGSKQTERTEEKKTYYFSERRFGAFQRSFRLPEDANLEAMEADFSNGVLTVRIAKRSAAASGPIRIPVKTG